MKNTPCLDVINMHSLLYLQEICILRQRTRFVPAKREQKARKTCRVSYKYSYCFFTSMKTSFATLLVLIYLYYSKQINVSVVFFWIVDNGNAFKTFSVENKNKLFIIKLQINIYAYDLMFSKFEGHFGPSKII